MHYHNAAGKFLHTCCSISACWGLVEWDSRLQPWERFFIWEGDQPSALFGIGLRFCGKHSDEQILISQSSLLACNVGGQACWGSHITHVHCSSSSTGNGNVIFFPNHHQNKHYCEQERCFHIWVTESNCITYLQGTTENWPKGIYQRFTNFTQFCPLDWVISSAMLSTVVAFLIPLKSICLEKCNSDEDWTVGHIVPSSQGWLHWSALLIWPQG